MDNLGFDARNGEFAFGDRPLLYGDDGNGNSLVLTLPLSPTHAFLACADEENCRAIACAPKSELVKYLNLQMVNQADANVYATDDRQARLIEKYLKRPPSDTNSKGASS